VGFTTRRVVLVAVIAALYMVFTVGVAPISYGPIQFRIAEVLKGLVLFDPWFSLGIGIGTFFANMTSPYVGPWELVFMPITDVLGGLLAWWIKRTLQGIRVAQVRPWAPWIAMLVYGLTTGLSVAVMLAFLGVMPLWLGFLSVGTSEVIILVAGWPILRRVGTMALHRAEGAGR